jgi:hypothetical protein
MAFVVWLLIWRTRFGYEMRTFGFQPEGGALCRHEGKAHHHHHHADLRRARRHDGAQPDHGRPAPHRSISSPAPASSASPWR